VSISETQQDEIEDIIEEFVEIRESQPGNYGLGFVDMTRDGKTVLAYEGGNDYTRYQTILSFHPNEYTSVGVSSYYLSLDELLPVFESIMERDFAQKDRDDYLNSLQFGLVSEDEFEGELYGFDQNLHLRQPAPGLMKYSFAVDHYVLNENDLTEKQNLNDIIPIPIPSNNIHDATIDYREWLPTWIAPGYYLKWVDITQPEDQYAGGNEGQGRLKFTFIPNGLEISEEITDSEFVDINMYVINVVLGETPSVYMKSSSEMDVTTRGGTATDITYENRWDGYIQYVYASRSDPAKHSVSYDSPYVSIASGGNALTMEQHENIVIELFERYSNR